MIIEFVPSTDQDAVDWSGSVRFTAEKSGRSSESGRALQTVRQVPRPRILAIVRRHVVLPGGAVMSRSRVMIEVFHNQASKLARAERRARKLALRFRRRGRR